MPDDDSTVTPIRCGGCLHKFEIGDVDRCPNCGRKLTPAQVVVSEKRSSGTFPGLERKCREMVVRLRSDARSHALTLAEKLERCAGKLHAWQKAPPSGEESSALHRELLDLIPAAERFLDGKLAR